MVCVTLTGEMDSVRLKSTEFSAVLLHRLCLPMTFRSLFGKLILESRLTFYPLIQVVKLLVLTPCFIRINFMPDEWCTTLCILTATVQLCPLVLAMALLFIPTSVGILNDASDCMIFKLKLVFVMSAPKIELGLQVLAIRCRPTLLAPVPLKPARLQAGHE